MSTAPIMVSPAATPWGETVTGKVAPGAALEAVPTVWINPSATSVKGPKLVEPLVTPFNGEVAVRSSVKLPLTTFVFGLVGRTRMFCHVKESSIVPVEGEEIVIVIV